MQLSGHIGSARRRPGVQQAAPLMPQVGVRFKVGIYPVRLAVRDGYR